MRKLYIHKSPKAVVEFVFEAREKGTPDGETTARMLAAGFSSADVDHIFEMITFAFDRAFMETLGGIHNADYDGCPYFKAALKKARRTFPPTPGVRRFEMITVATGTAAILVGLFAIGAVVYYAVDFWRTTH